MNAPLAFRLPGEKTIRVNFGVYAGRNATQAEIDDLARELRGLTDTFAIVAEDRHEFGQATESFVRQVVIELGDGDDGEFARKVVTLAEQWATACIESHAELGELADF